MTDREKLIGIIDDCHVYVTNIETLTDHLIANGVTFATDTNDGDKHGRWIIHSSGRGEYANNWAECSECHVCGSPQWKVCPVCEAKMDLEESK